MKLTTKVLSLLLASTLASHAAVTLTISAVTGASNGVLTNLGSSTVLPTPPNVTSTKVWGIIVDTNGDGIRAGDYLGTQGLNDFGPSLAQGTASVATRSVLQVANVLGNAAETTDDILYIGTNLMVNTNNATLDGGTVAVGNLARPTLISGVSYTDLAVGDDFYLIWFDRTAFGGKAQVGEFYGTMRVSGMDIPADGAAVSFNSLFVGADPVRIAEHQFVAVPEPSTAALGLLAGLGLIARRRRA